jgi:hypothetical protein
MNRWEYWVALLGVNSPIPIGIFDSAQPLNGINQFWNRLANVSGWSMNYRLKFLIQQNLLKNEHIDLVYEKKQELTREALDTLQPNNQLILLFQQHIKYK